mmetsp:Transcript_6280/g.15048  ORF Transcript_6280/g.15048 Transcript_6280/m.15048 type:complete len:454 (+) Transcript_6280:87-1448(+)
MSYRMLQKQCGVEPSTASTEGSGGRGGKGYKGGEGRGGAAYPPGGGYYGTSSAPGEQQNAVASAPRVMAPTQKGGFRGSAAQQAHIEATKAAMREQQTVSRASCDTTELATRSGLGLSALKERQQREEDEKQQRRDAARAKRHGEEVQREVEEEQALAQCEEQAKVDSEEAGLKYEAALVVRIAVRFGTSGVWMKLAEARARGAQIPMDPKRVYVLAHPDKCALPEASDATAILNAQRPPEMTEAATKPKARPSPSTFVKSDVKAADAAEKEVLKDPKTEEANSSEAANTLPPALCAALDDVLEKSKLTRHRDKACAWCIEMGAIGFEEVLDSVDDFATALGLKPLEKKRLVESLGAPQPRSKAVSRAAVSEPCGVDKATAESSDQAQDPERKVDPEDGKACTFEELRVKYKEQYSKEEIEAYWKQECTVESVATEKAAVSVSSRPAPKSRRY